MAFLIHDEDDYGSRRFLVLGFAQKFERGIKPRYAHGKSCGRNRLPGEARHKIIIAPAASDGAEAYRLSVLVFRFHQKFTFKNGASVVFETTDN